MIDLRILRCRLPDRDGFTDISIHDGKIVGIGGVSESPGPLVGDARERIDAAGRLVTTGLVDAHIHLDKALLSGRVTASAGTLEEAIRLTGEAKRRFTVDDIRARARRVLDMAVAAGTTAMRTHVEVDPIVGLAGMEAILPLREEYAPALELQVCAFAQEGILQAPGTEVLLRRALSMGADLVGGCPYNDTDGVEQIRIVFGLAQAFGVDADFHVDFFDEPDHLHIHEIVEQTVRASWQGRVVVGHLTELAALPPDDQDAVIERIKAAGIGVISLPATDLYLMGRRDQMNVRRGLTPIRRLMDAGVAVALATNNVRNPFTPIGTADLTHMTFLAAVAAHMGTPSQMRQLFAGVTVNPARMLRLSGYGLELGAHADLVVWDCEAPEDIVAALPPVVTVVKRGRISVECERRIRERWRTP